MKSDRSVNYIRWNHTNHYLIKRFHSKSQYTAIKEIGVHRNSYVSSQRSIIIETCSIVGRFLTCTTQTPTIVTNESTHLALVCDRFTFTSITAKVKEYNNINNGTILLCFLLQFYLIMCVSHIFIKKWL